MTDDLDTVDDALLADAVRESPIGVTLADVRQDDDPLVYVNDAFEQITGYSREEILGKNCRFLQGPDTDPGKRAAFREAIANREATTVELKNYRKDGTPFWNLVKIAPVRQDGEVTHYVGFQQDVTARVEAEGALEADRAELALLNRVVRHDIRNDMTVVAGWAQRLADEVDEENQELVDRIVDRANHVTELTGTLGDLVEALTGGEDIPVEPVDLRETVLDEVELVRETYGDERDLDLRVEDVPDVDVLANRMLCSVLENLLSNAIRHNPSEEPTVVVTGDADEEWVTVRVSDDGPGIPPDQRQAVFGRGEKGLESPGAGLGLYLVDRLVDGFGGDVHVEESALGGAAFVVRLPRA